MSYQLSDEQRKRLRDLHYVQYSTSKIVGYIEKELAPAISEEGRQAGLEEAAIACEQLELLGQDNLVIPHHCAKAVRALKEKF